MALFERWLIADDSHQHIWMRAQLLVRSDCVDQIDYRDIENLASGRLVRHGVTDSFLFVPDRDGTARVRSTQAAFAMTLGVDGHVHLAGECSLCRKTGCRHIAAGLFAAVASARPGFLRHVSNAQSGHTLTPQAASFLIPFFTAAPAERDELPRGRMVYVLTTLHNRGLVGHLSLEYWTSTGGKSLRMLLDRAAVAHLIGVPAPDLQLGALNQLKILATALTPADLRCLRLIYSSGAIDVKPGFVDLAVPGGHELIQLALSTERLVHDSQPRSAHSLGEPRPFSLAWSRSADGLSSLNASISPAGVLIPTSPPWYLDPEKHIIGPAVGQLSQQLASALPHASSISDKDLNLILDAMLFADTRHGLPHSVEFTRVDVGRVTPLPQVHLYFKPASADFDPQCRQTSGAGAILADLTFDYRGERVHQMDHTALQRAVSASETIQLFQIRDRERHVLERDLPSELRVADALLAILPGLAGPAGPFILLGGDYWSDALRTTARALVSSVKDLIASLGGTVTLSPTILDTGTSATDFVLEASNPDGTWLDFSITADINGRRTDITQAIRRLFTDPRALKGLLAGEQPDVVLQVDRATWAAFSRDALKGLVPLFKALDFDRTVGRARISRVHSAAVAEAQKALDAEIRSPASLIDLIQRLQAPPAGLNPGTLELLKEPPHAYQIDAAAWCAARRAESLGGVIADEYATGKTLQSLLTVSDAYFETQTPSLVVVTKTLFVDRKWQHEAQRFLPDMRLVEVRSTRDLDLLRFLTGVAMVITTYDTLALNSQAFRGIHWNAVVADEAHKLGNHRTSFYAAVDSLTARQKLAITGSPLLNRPTEIWALMNLTVPGLLNTRRWFERSFPQLKRLGVSNDGPDHHDNAQDRSEHEQRMKALGRLIAPFQLRRTNASVNRKLPPIVEERRAVVLSRPEADLYDLVRLSTQSQVQDAIRTLGATRAESRILPLLLKMRQVCCDWRLLKDGNGEQRTPSAKSEAILETCEEFAADGKFVMVTSEWSEWLSLLHSDLTRAGIGSSLVIGKIGGDRARAQALENYRSGKHKVLLLQLAMAEGVDLPETDVHIIAEPWWNRAREDQATARARRDVRDKTVTVIRMHVAGSVEDGVEQLATAKKADLQTINSGADDLPKDGVTDAYIEMMLRPLLQVDSD